MSRICIPNHEHSQQVQRAAGILGREVLASFTAKFEEQYAILLESDVPVVAQYGRAEPRTVAFYTTPGYCE